MAKKRLVSMIIGMAFLCTISVSLFFLTSEAFHHCDGEDCPVCTNLQQCIHMINSLALEAVVTLSLLFQKYFDKNKDPKKRQCDEKNTLVSLKIKLSN